MSTHSQSDQEGTDLTNTPSAMKTDIWTAIKARRRRDIIRLIAVAPNNPDLGGLAFNLAWMEAGHEPSSVERKRARIAAYQSHIPTLRRTDVVEAERKSGPYARGPNFDAAHRAVSAVDHVLADGVGRLR